MYLDDVGLIFPPMWERVGVTIRIDYQDYNTMVRARKSFGFLVPGLFKAPDFTNTQQQHSQFF